MHPGYGFLAETAEFSEISALSGIVFIGPNPEQIRAMGDKATARRTMIEHGVPTVPGTADVVPDPDAARAAAEELGFPIMIKASAGDNASGALKAALAAASEATRDFAAWLDQQAPSKTGQSGIGKDNYTWSE